VLTAIIAVALQSTPLLEDRAFLAAHEAWAACTNRVADADAASARSAEEITAEALAACTAEQEIVRRAVIANAGETRAPETMAIMLGGNREGLVDRVREVRRRAGVEHPASPLSQAGPSYETAATALAQCQKDHVDAALPSGARDREILDAALHACPDEEAVTRVAAVRMLRTDHFMIEVRTIARDAMRRYIRERRRH
jgi:hypothetical protein